MAKRKQTKRSPARRRSPRSVSYTVLIGLQKDPATDNWYFMVYADERRERVLFQSEPLYAEESEAEEAAAGWLNSRQGTR